MVKAVGRCVDGEFVSGSRVLRMFTYTIDQRHFITRIMGGKINVIKGILYEGRSVVVKEAWL